MAHHPGTTPYRLYPLNERGRITSAATVIEARSDDEAIELAKSTITEVDKELWRGACLVVVLPAGRTPAASALPWSMPAIGAPQMQAMSEADVT